MIIVRVCASMPLFELAAAVELDEAEDENAAAAGLDDAVDEGAVVVGPDETADETAVAVELDEAADEVTAVEKLVEGEVLDGADVDMDDAGMGVPKSEARLATCEMKPGRFTEFWPYTRPACNSTVTAKKMLHSIVTRSNQIAARIRDKRNVCL